MLVVVTFLLVAIVVTLLVVLMVTLLLVLVVTTQPALPPALQPGELPPKRFNTHTRWLVVNLLLVTTEMTILIMIAKGSHHEKKVSMNTFRRGGRAQPHSIAFGGAFTNFTEANSG